MNNLEKEIQKKKEDILLKKKQLQDKLQQSKSLLSSTLLYDASIMGGLLLSYLILPKRFGRLLFKSVSLLSTIKAVKGLMQNQSEATEEKRTRRATKPRKQTSRRRTRIAKAKE